MTAPPIPHLEVRVDQVRARPRPDGAVEILANGRVALVLTPASTRHATQMALRILAGDIDRAA